MVSLSLEAASSLLVDGNNVLGARPDGWWRDRPAATRRLAAELAALAAGMGVPITVVFDGTAPDEPIDEPPDEFGDHLRVRYAGRGPDAADDVIADLAAEVGGRGGLVVVTADRRLRERVTAVGVGVVGPRALLAAVEAFGAG